MAQAVGTPLPDEAALALNAAPVASRGRVPWLFPALIVLLAGAALLNAGIGAVHIAPMQVISILLHHAGIHIGPAYTLQQDAVLWVIRLPRICMALLVGGALGLAGAALQGVFRNPLADPSIIGVSSGAAAGAVLIVLIGIRPFGQLTLPAAAFAGGAVATAAVYGFARFEGRAEVVTLVLAGVAMNAVANAATGLMTFMASPNQLRGIVFWSLGSVGGATWQGVGSILPFMLIGFIVLPRYGRTLNLLVLGESEARHLGVEPERARLIVVALAAMLTGASVAVAGVVAFIGLVIPHMVRLVAGPDHRTLLPASALLGGALLLLADLCARTLAVPQEIPLGVVTALVGGPFFLWLLHYTRRQHGGWG
jgi:iron complex transport system permease protein